jgi:cytochrome c oxidase subunit 4
MEHTSHDGAAHAGGHDEAHPHITPLRNYVRVWGALMALTVVTVAAAQINLGPLNVPLALAIATLKASLVALFFMHLFYDDRFLSVVFGSGLLFLLIFASLTIIDPLTRGDVDRIERHDLGPSMIRLKSDLYLESVATTVTTTTQPAPAAGGAREGAH